MRLIALATVLGIAVGCTDGHDGASVDDWQETSFTDERGLKWRVAVSLVADDDRSVVQGWSGVQNDSAVEQLLENVQNCGSANPVDLRTADGEVLLMDPFLGEGNIDQISTDRCQAKWVRLPPGETLWMSAATWDGIADGRYELFGTFWNGNAAALRFAL